MHRTLELLVQMRHSQDGTRVAISVPGQQVKLDLSQRTPSMGLIYTTPLGIRLTR